MRGTYDVAYRRRDADVDRRPTRPAEFATLTDDDLVTGEAVALDLPPASLGPRIASGLIDVTVTVVLLVAGDPGLRDRHAQHRRGAARVAVVGTLIIVVRWSSRPTSRPSPAAVARQAGARAAHGARRRRPDHVPARVRPGADRIRRDLRLLRRPGVLLRAAQHARQAARRLRRRHLRRPRPGHAPAAAPPPMPPQLAGWAATPTSPRCRPGWRSPYASSSAGCPRIDPASRASGSAPGSPSRCGGTSPPAAAPGAPPEAFLAAVIAAAPRPGPRPAAPRGRAPAPAHLPAMSTSRLRAPGDVLVHLRRARDHADRHYADRSTSTSSPASPA